MDKEIWIEVDKLNLWTINFPHYLLLKSRHTGRLGILHIANKGIIAEEDYLYGGVFFLEIAKQTKNKQGKKGQVAFIHIDLIYNTIHQWADLI